MKKRVVVILSFVMAIVLCFPSVPAYAEESYRFITSDSISGYSWGSAVSGAEIDLSVYACNTFVVSNSVIDNVVLPALEDLTIDLNDYYYILTVYHGSQVNLGVISKTAYEFIDCVAINQDVNTNSYNGITMCYRIDESTLSNVRPNVRIMQYVPNSHSWTDLQGNTNAQSSSEHYWYYSFGNQQYEIVSLNMPLYIMSEMQAVNAAFAVPGNENPYYPSTGSGSRPLLAYIQNGDKFDNFNPDSLTYYNGSSIVDPTAPVGESNSNHLYLSNFDAGYCKPYHMEELYRAGGGYLYFTYDFDSWINSHSDDYQLQVITQLNVDGNATTYNSVWPLDLQGCLVLPFNRLASSYQWSDENILFIEYEDESLFSNYNRGYVYAINYLKYIDPTTQKGIRSMGNGRTRSFVSSNGSTHRLIGDDPAEENYFSGQSNHTQFLMSVTVRMVDNVSGDVSGSFTKTFNLLNGVSTVSNNQIRDNTNPYEPTSDDLYFPIQDSGGGYGYGGGNNQLVNFQFPSDIELFIDNGFKQFLSWYETSADTAYATNRFWSSMGIFEGNPATDLYKEYFGFLPDDFKTLIFSCAGIGIVGGAFCILRRRLH